MNLAPLAIALAPLLSPVPAIASSEPVFVEEPFLDLGFEAARARAEKEGKLILIDFFTTWCGPCKQLDRTTWKDPLVRAWLANETIALKIDAEKEVDLARRFGVRAYPSILLLHPDGRIVDRLVGYRNAGRFLGEASAALAGRDSVDRARGVAKSAGNDPTARLALIRELLQSGEPDAALAEIEWCWDHGLEHEPAFAGVRVSFLLSEWARLARDHAPARDALAARRKGSVEALLTGNKARMAAHEIANIDEFTGKPEQTLELYEELRSNGEGAAAKALGPAVFAALVEARRYADALEAAQPLEQRFESLAQLEGVNSPLARMTDREGALYLEALLGTGDQAGAEQLVERLEPSKASWAFLAKAAHRAGNDEFAHMLEVREDQTPAPADTKPMRSGRQVKASALGSPTVRRGVAAVASDALELQGLEITWSTPGAFTGVAVDRDMGRIYSAERKTNSCMIFDTTGEAIGRFPIPERMDILRTGRFASPLAPDRPRRGVDIVGYRSWGKALHAFNSDGVPLWISATPAGTNDAWRVDLDGDGLDELAVGLNGSGGLLQLEPDGTRGWKEHSFKNIWHVGASDLTGDGIPEVFGSSGAGRAHVHDSTGAVTGSFGSRVHVHSISVCDDDGTPALLAVGSADTQAFLVCHAPTGEERWHLQLPREFSRLKSFEVHPGLPLAVLASKAGALVVDLRSHEIVARVAGGSLGQVTWMPTQPGEAPAFVVTTGADLAVLRVE